MKKNPWKYSALLLLLTFLLPAINSSAGNNDGSFTENKGQIIDTEGKSRPDILFTGNNEGTSLYLRKTGISYVLTKTDPVNEEVLDNIKQLEKLFYYTHRIDLDFINCNPSAQIEKQDETGGYKNYYYAHCPDGITHVKSYNTILQKNLYNNIDIVYKGNKANGLKYDIVVNPGGNPSDIKIKYSGANNTTLKDGELIVETSLGKIIESMPKVYQNIDGKIVDIEAKYILEGSTVSFNITSQYSHLYPIIIDPWVTFFGGAAADYGHGITADASGNVIFTGVTMSNNFPVLGAFQGTLAAPADAFVAKMNAAGALQWSTYYGGTGHDPAYGICGHTSNDDIYFAGSTLSSNFPIGATGGNTSFLNTYPNANSAYLVKLDASGIRLWATFYGDVSGTTQGYVVTTDINNNVILGGRTTAPANMTTAGTFQPNHSGIFYNDGYVVKFNSTGNRQWASYCGGSDDEMVTDISCSATNDIYITGHTESLDFPVSAGAHQTTMVQGGGGSAQYEAYLVKLTPTGTGVWATYYGGPMGEYGWDVQVDLNDDVYIVGQTESLTGITQAGLPSYQATKNTGATEDGFVAKFSPTGNLIWATYLGGTGRDYVTGISVDNNNNIVVGGDTFSPDFPVTSCAYYTSFVGAAQQSITTFDSNCNLICSGFAGATANLAASRNTSQNQGTGSVTTSGGYVYLIAWTHCNYATTTGAYQQTCGGNADAVVVQLCATSCGSSVINADFNASNTNICSGNSVNFSLQNTSCSQANTTFLWTFTGATPSSSTSQHPTNIVYNNAGIYNVKVVIETPCGKDSVIKNAYINVGGLSATFNNVTDVNCYGGNDGSASITVSGGGGNYTYSWSNGSTGMVASNLSAGNFTITATDPSGCSSTHTVTIAQPTALTATINSSPSVICVGQTVTISTNINGGVPSYQYNWSNGQSLSSITVQPLSNTVYSLTVADNNGCFVIMSDSIIVNPLPIVSFEADNAEGCSAFCVSFNNTSSTGSTVWNFGDGTSSSSNTHCYSQTGSFNVLLTVTDVNGCSASLTKNNYISVHPNPIAAFSSSPTGSVPDNTPVQFINQSSGATSWLWNFGDQHYSSSQQQSPSFTYSDMGTYRVMLIVENEFGCTDTAYSDIEIIQEHTLFIPNSFTPNGDGKNDFFAPEFTNITQNNCLLSIFDRWGNLIFKTNNISTGWDGRVMGNSNIAQIDTYVWKLIANKYDGQEINLTGHINLLK